MSRPSAASRSMVPCVIVCGMGGSIAAVDTIL
jgi:hypothetical protein